MINKKPSSILYHYTSGDGVLGIVESDSIWATRIQYMNDSKELSYALRLARLLVLKKRDMADDELIVSICNGIDRFLEGASRLNIYVACFSEDGDSLSQWRGYCPPGFGYSLGFDRSVIDRIGMKSGFYLKNFIYDLSVQRNLIFDWIDTSIDVLSNDYYVKNGKPNYYEICSRLILDGFLKFAPYLKHPSFKEELEWRLVARISENEDRIKLRSGKSMLIPYVQINLNLNSQESPLYYIKVGPSPHIELAMESLLNLYKKVNIKGSITHTDTPYRDW